MKIRFADPSWTEKEAEIVRDALINHSKDYFYVEKFEKEFAEWHNRKYTLMTPCCTHALHLILAGLGIKEGDEVILPESTWIGSSECVTYCGAKPVFCDVEERNWCLDPKSVEKNITPKTKAIIVVDLYGNMPNMDGLLNISEKYNIPLVEDSAEALGSSYNGIKAGKFGIASAFSFHRTKTLAVGEGGILLTDNEELYNKCKKMRDHGRSEKFPYQIDIFAFKYMPSNPQAALAYAQFTRLNELLDKKKKILSWYKKHLAGTEGLILNEENIEIENGAWATSLIFEKYLGVSSEEALKKLNEKGIPAREFFRPLSTQPCYKSMGYSEEKHKIKNPVAYDLYSRGITLPCSFDMTEEQAIYICDEIKNLVDEKFIY